MMMSFMWRNLEYTLFAHTIALGPYECFQTKGEISFTVPQESCPDNYSFVPYFAPVILKTPTISFLLAGSASSWKGLLPAALGRRA